LPPWPLADRGFYFATRYQSNVPDVQQNCFYKAISAILGTSDTTDKEQNSPRMGMPPMAPMPIAFFPLVGLGPAPLHVVFGAALFGREGEGQR